MSYANIVLQIKDSLKAGDFHQLLEITRKYSRRQRRELAYYYEQSCSSNHNLPISGQDSRSTAAKHGTTEVMKRNYMQDSMDTTLSESNTKVIRRDLSVTEARMSELAAIVAANDYSHVLSEDIKHCFRTDLGLLLSYWWCNPLELKCRILYKAFSNKDITLEVAMCVFSCLTEVDFLKLCDVWHKKYDTDLKEQMCKVANPRRPGHALVLSWITFDKILSPSVESDALMLMNSLNSSKPNFDSIIRIFGLRVPEQWNAILTAYKRKSGQTMDESLNAISHRNKDRFFFVLAHSALLSPTALTCTILEYSAYVKVSVSHLALLAGAFNDNSLTNDEVYTEELQNILSRYPPEFADTLITLWARKL